MDYDEFRLQVSPDLTAAGQWRLELLECPIAALVGQKGVTTAAFTPQQLARMRSAQAWPDLATLQAAGNAIWQSLMTPTVEAAFEAARIISRNAHRGLRLIVVSNGEESAVLPGRIRLAELPIEALHHNVSSFLATDEETPVSRSFQARADAAPVAITFPLRVLVVVATPDDKPPANAAQEKLAITQALQPFSDEGLIHVEFCEPGTPERLAEKLRDSFHVLHFIGHGGVQITGDDPTPRAHLCFVNAITGRTHALDAATLDVRLRNSGVHLVVITGCATAQPVPAGPHDDGAFVFSGVAQRLVAGISDVTAAVAMQFDLEAPAAELFSREFYHHLLSGEGLLDEAVTAARKSLATANGLGHRCWVTPTVHWRCMEGRVFDFRATRAVLDDDKIRQLGELQTMIAFVRKKLDRIANLPPEAQPFLVDIRAETEAELDEFNQRRALLLGQSLRLTGGRTTVDRELACRLTLRLLTPGRIEQVTVRLRYPEERLESLGAIGGNGAAGAAPAIAAIGPGAFQAVILRPSQGAVWAAGEHELGMFRFRVRPATPPGSLDVRLDQPEVERDGAAEATRTQDAIIFVLQPPG